MTTLDEARKELEHQGYSPSRETIERWAGVTVIATRSGLKLTPQKKPELNAESSQAVTPADSASAPADISRPRNGTRRKAAKAEPEPAPPTNAEIRAWCAENGVEVNKSGPNIKKTAMLAYNAAHERR